MDLTRLLSLIEDMPAYGQLIIAGPHQVQGRGLVLLDAAKPYLIAALNRQWQQPILVVTAQPGHAKKLSEQLSAWTSTAVRVFPEPDALPYERVTSDATTELERVRVLSMLANCQMGEEPAEPPLIIASAPALMMKTVSYHDFAAACSTIKVGMDIEPYRLLRRWTDSGYQMEGVVEVPGTVSHRGGIIDIYPLTSELPARLEFFGNTVESIRLFAPENQRSLEKIESISVAPATEMLAPLQSRKSELERILRSLDLANLNTEAREQYKQEIATLLEGQRPPNSQFYASLFNQDSLIDYLSRDAILMLDEPQSIEQAMEELQAEAEQMRMEKLGKGELPRDFPHTYFSWEEVKEKLDNRECLVLTTWGDNEESLRLDFAPAPNYAGQLPSFCRRVKQLIEQKRKVVVVSHQASRLSELLEEEDIISVPVSEIKEAPSPGSLTLVQGSLAEGWVMNGETYLFTDAEIFGFVKQRRQVKKHPVPRQKLFVDIAPGDYVVHVEHGIAKFTEVRTLRRDGNEREYLVLRYAAGDRLYVPTDQIDRVSRYIGAGDRPPVLSRLGTQEWSRTKQRAKEAAEDLAQELLALYATREVVPGFAFSRDTLWQQEMEASFPYVETPDQMEAQHDVKGDMEKRKPMDRLVCGDVGYGKTEVAIRAAFKAVMDNKQVAVLVPTTVLAQQHYATFRERLDAFPVRIEALSRFKSPGEQNEIIEGMAEGRVDVCIGTHRLLQKDVRFRDLGLLIIDEEQRFGVNHKEYLKKMRREVDVLTLSATPIPRTLHMSLVGVRDMSTMETPPDERLPIKTYVAEYNDRLIREAILRELERDGQVFFVHNRVQSIGLIAQKLETLVPEARFAIAHGRMPEDALETVMADFAQSKSDVLVCTTIIESGLDMPNVNTLIVNQADKFGLTQLYQLRGRVGRGANLAHAYFLYDREKRLTPTAQKRLRTIYEATELGAGFNIAMKDLEIRGAGTLLGTKQSGYITAIGFNLYCRLLAEAVEAQKAKLAGVKEEVKPPRLPTPSINLPLDAYIPEDYVPDLETRLGMYQKLVKVEELGRIDTLAQEFLDRFGALPEEVQNLLYAVRIKLLAATAGIESVATEHGQIVIRRFEGLPFDRQKLEPIIRDGVRVGHTQISLNLRRIGKEWKEVLGGVVGKTV
ncbi:MAG: transcription-repair coupling factor [Chloroflexota bacterium]